MLDTQLIVIIILLAVIVAMGYWLWKTEQRFKQFFRGSRAENLEDSMKDALKTVQNIENYHEELHKNLHTLDTRLRRSIQGVATVRFNPFSDSGGDQSFATALLDEDGNGLVISSLYSREKTSVFAKPIKKHESQYELTNEEKQALQQARRS
jgi:Flp pilus assembly protein TadB